MRVAACIAPERSAFYAVSLSLITACLFVALPFASAEGESKALQVGMAKTFFTERPMSFVALATDPFKDICKKTTGFEAELILKYGAEEVAQNLNDKKLDLGIFHGHEFAWAHKKYSDLKPLLIAVNKQRDFKVFVIVRRDNSAKSITDLRGKKMDLPLASGEQSRVYLKKYAQDKDHPDSTTFFSAMQKSETPEAALDEVSRGKVDATVVDSVALRFYKEIKGPVFEKNLKVLQESEPFPPAVVAYKEGGLSADTLAKFRAGVLRAHDSVMGRDMMEMWKIDAFEPVSKDFSKTMEETLKRYPSPPSLR